MALVVPVALALWLAGALGAHDIGRPKCDPARGAEHRQQDHDAPARILPGIEPGERTASEAQPSALA